MSRGEIVINCDDSSYFKVAKLKNIRCEEVITKLDAFSPVSWHMNSALVPSTLSKHVLLTTIVGKTYTAHVEFDASSGVMKVTGNNVKSVRVSFS